MIMKGIILLLFGAVFVNGLDDKCSNCLPRAHLRVYERRSCKPVMSPECDCPLYYDCPPEVTTPRLPKAERRKLKKLGENACIFEDKVFAIGEEVKIPCVDLSICRCVASETARNVSGHVIKSKPFLKCGSDDDLHEDCGGWGLPELPAGCHGSYFPDGCGYCPSGRICAGHEKLDFRCMAEEKEYRYGEKIEQMEKDFCKSCLCDEKFDENDLEGSTCLQHRCYPIEWRWDSAKNRIDENHLMQHCTPIYNKKECCHYDFICDKDFKPDAGSFKARPTNLTDTCVLRGRSYKIGQKRKFKPKHTFNKYYEQREGKCTCRVPPLMTCYYD